MNHIKILGAGHAKAKCCVTNDDLSQVVQTSDEWISTRTGIHTRYVSENENTSDLACRASLMAIENANIEKEKIDLIIVATMTPDHITPSCACLVQEKLGLNGCHVMAFDLNGACTGFIYALQVASHMLESYHYALVIGAETLSKIVDWTDRNTCVLFGDGAGAVVISQQSSHKGSYFYANSIGDNSGVLEAKGLPLHQPLKNTLPIVSYLSMDGQEVFRFAVKAMENAINEVLKESKKGLDAIDLIIPHQANIRIIQYVAKKIKVDLNRFYINLDKYGNTSAASVPMALSEAMQEGRLKEGMTVILVGFGAGFTYGACLIEL